MQPEVNMPMNQKNGGFMLNFLFWMALFIGIPTASTTAQQPYGGAGGTSPTREGPDVPSLEPLTFDLTGDLLQVDTERNAIQIRIKRTEKLMGFLVDSKCKIKGDKKQFEKKDLALAELEAGYQLELKVRRADIHVIEMKVKKPKEKSQERVIPPKN